MHNDRNRGFGDFGRNRLYRNREDGVIAGVCAGIADYFGFDIVLTRVIVAVAAVFFSPFILVVYVVLALVLESKPPRESDVRDKDREEVSRRVRSEPHATLKSVRYRFRELDQRLQRIEKYVTSDRFALDREFEGLTKN
jgi:phage shock protein C